MDEAGLPSVSPLNTLSFLSGTLFSRSASLALLEKLDLPSLFLAFSLSLSSCVLSAAVKLPSVGAGAVVGVGRLLHFVVVYDVACW